MGRGQTSNPMVFNIQEAINSNQKLNSLNNTDNGPSNNYLNYSDMDT